MTKSEGGPKVLSGEKKETLQFDRFRKYFDRSFAPTKSQFLSLTDQKVILGVIMLCARAGIRPSAITFLNSCPDVTLVGDDNTIAQKLKSSIPNTFCDTLLSHGIDSAPTLTNEEKEYLKSAILCAQEVVARRPKKQGTELKEVSPKTNKQVALRVFGSKALADMITEHGGTISGELTKAVSEKLGIVCTRQDILRFVKSESLEISDFLKKYIQDYEKVLRTSKRTRTARSDSMFVLKRAELKESLLHVLVNEKDRELCNDIVKHCNEIVLKPNNEREQYEYPKIPWVLVVVTKDTQTATERFIIRIDLEKARLHGKETEASRLMKAFQEIQTTMFTRPGVIGLYSRGSSISLQIKK